MAGLIANIKSLFTRFIKADIVKVFSLTSVSTLVKMCTGLVSVKVVASIIGPAGVALVGQLNNFAQIALTFSNAGITSGITKYVAEFKDDDSKVAQYLSNALRITVICSLIFGVLLIALHRYPSELIMLSPDYGYVFIIFGFTILFYALNTLLTSIVNGYKEFKKYVKINIAGSIFGVIFTVTLVYFWQLKGALIASVTFQSFMLFVSLWMLRKCKWLSWSFFKDKWNKAICSQYFRYALMAITTALTVPIMQMIFRGYVISEISAVEAGWWEGMNRISNMYLMVVTSSFTVYYLPKLSETTDPVMLRHEIFKAYKVIVPMLLAGFALVYVLRFFIIRLLFTPEFMPMSQLFGWQMAGDFFKICSWLLAFLMVAKAMTKFYIASEIIFVAIHLVLGLIFVRLNGIVGLTQAYLIYYIIYTLAMIFFFRKTLFLKKSSRSDNE